MTTRTEERILKALSPTKGNSASDRTDRISKLDVYQRAGDWFQVPREEDPVEHWKNHPVVGKLLEVVDASSHVLDLGCGVGWPTFPLGLFVREIVGVDASPEMIKIARRLQPSLDRRRNVRFECCDARHLPFGDESFDAVVSDNMIDVAEDQIGVLEEIFRVLRPGGGLCLLFESFRTALGEKGVEERFEYENDPGEPRCVYTVRGSQPSFFEREYVVRLDPASALGCRVLSASREQLGGISTDVDQILGSARACRYWESVHHDNASVGKLLVQAGFSAVESRGEGAMVCRKPAGMATL